MVSCRLVGEQTGGAESPKERWVVLTAVGHEASIERKKKNKQETENKEMKKQWR